MKRSLSVRQQASKRFIAKDNLLYHVTKDKVFPQETIHKQVVCLDEEKEALLRGCHDGIDGGHLGRYA